MVGTVPDGVHSLTHGLVSSSFTQTLSKHHSQHGYQRDLRSSRCFVLTVEAGVSWPQTELVMVALYSARRMSQDYDSGGDRQTICLQIDFKKHLPRRPESDLFSDPFAFAEFKGFK